MTQDTRKDPRAKVLTMTVRYKSATLDEFIEHHSHDVSRGGMFIKTPSPFPPGTLLKFEVKIAAEQRVMQGVGRVVWKRETSEATDARPAGMGVKFIKIDDESRRVIDQLVVARGDAQSHFEQGAEVPAAAAAPKGAELRAAAPKPESDVGAPQRAARKSTMIGLGAMGETPAPAASADSSFFPKSTDNDMPAPEDRTVMKQAAELLQDALREAGGSLEDVGAASVSSSREAKRAETPAPASVKADSSREAEPRVAEARTAEEPVAPPPKPAPKPAASTKAISERPPALEKPAAPKAAAVPARPGIPAAQRPAVTPQASGGGGKVVLVVAAVALVAGVVFFATRQEPSVPGAPSSETPTAPPAAEPAVPPAAAVQPTPAPTPVIEASAVPAATVAPPPAVSAAPPAPPSPAAEAPVAPKPVRPVAPAVKPRSKVAPEAAPAAPAAQPPAEAPAAPPAEKPAAAPAEKPAAAPPAAEAPAEKAAPAAKPKAAPKKAASEGDNPY